MPTEPFTEAQDPRTAPERLRWLASSPHSDVRRAVATNPNTPEAVLMQLAPQFPAEVLNNPLLELLLLVNPNFWAEVPAYARNALIGSPEAKEGFLRWACKNGDTDTLLSVLRNPKAPSGAVEELANINLPAVREAAQMHVSLEASSLPMALWWAELDSDIFELRQLVLCGQIPPWLAPRLAREPDALIRQSLAETTAQAEVLEALLFDEEETVRAAAKANKNATDKSLRMLEYLEAGTGDWVKPDVPNPELPPLELLAKGHVWLRQAVARHPMAPLELLQQLALDEDWRVRAALAANHRAPSVVLEQLAADHDRDVRSVVAQNPAVSAAILERLVGDESEEVRKAASENPHSPKEMLDLLERIEAQDTALSAEELAGLAQRLDWAKRLAAAHPNTPTETLEHCRQEADWHTRLAVAKNPKAPAEVLAELAQDSDAEVRQAVAAHSNTPLQSLIALGSDDLPDVRTQTVYNPQVSLELLLKLGRDEHWKVREAVAAHALTPPEVLAELAEDTDRDVRQAVAGNPNVPETALETLFGNWFAVLKSPWSLTELYRRMIGFEAVPAELLLHFAEGNEWAKRLAARHPSTPDPTLWQLSSDEDWRVRQAVAQNPAASSELLARMAQDTDVDVRRAVLQHSAVSDSTLDQLAIDEQQDLRLRVAEHPRASVFALSRLLSDEDESVRKAAHQNPGTLPQQIELHRRAEGLDASLETAFLEQLFSASAWGRSLVAQNSSSPTELLGQAASDTDWRVRQALAKNPEALPDALASLTHDTDRDVRQAVAEHPNTPQSSLIALLNDSDDSVRLAALRNPALAASALEQHRSRLIVQASRSRYSLNRALALAQPGIPVLELAKLRHRTSPAWIVRYALTQNPNTPLEALAYMAQDGNRLVREAAQKMQEHRKDQSQKL